MKLFADIQKKIAADRSTLSSSPAQVAVARKGLKGLWSSSPIFANDIAAVSGLATRAESSFASLDAKGMAACYADDALFDDDAFSLRGRHAIGGMWSMLVDAIRKAGPQGLAAGGRATSPTTARTGTDLPLLRDGPPGCAT